MSTAEQLALAAVVQEFHTDTKHGEISPEFQAEALRVLLEVRTAFDTMRHPKVELTEHQRQLIEPSME